MSPSSMFSFLLSFCALFRRGNYVKELAFQRLRIVHGGFHGNVGRRDWAEYVENRADLLKFFVDNSFADSRGFFHLDDDASARRYVKHMA